MHPILFKIGPVEIYSYGVMISLAFMACTFLMWRNAHLVGMDRHKVLDFVIVILVFGILGARLLHVAANYRYYMGRLYEIPMLTHGGLAFYGGLIFAIIAGIIFLKKNALPIWRTGDLIAPYAALGQAIGRIGCLLNGCCYGTPCPSGYIGIIFPSDIVPRHPTQVYATLALLVIFVILHITLTKGYLKGRIFLLYLILYSFQRFFLEFLRGDVQHIYCGMTLSQVISIFVFLTAGLIFLWRSYKIGTA